MAEELVFCLFRIYSFKLIYESRTLFFNPERIIVFQKLRLNFFKGPLSSRESRSEFCFLAKYLSKAFLC